MARAYRPMKAEGAPPRPVLGDSAKKLGVRPFGLSPDEDGTSLPDRGGSHFGPDFETRAHRTSFPTVP